MKSRNKDILFLCQFFYPEYISSAMLPFDTAKYLKEQGYSVGVLCGYPKEYREGSEVPERECVDGIDIHRIKYVQMGREKALGRLINYFSFVIFMLLHIVEAKNYKIVILYSNPPLLPVVAWLCKKIYKTKLVYVSYDVYPEIAIKTSTIGENGLTARIFRTINSLFFKKVDRVVALSNDMQCFLREHRNINKDRVCVIPNWYEDSSKSKKSVTSVLDTLPSNAFIISYLGNLGTCQDADVIEKLAKQLRYKKDIFFVIAGHGNKLQTLKENIEKNKLNNMIVFPFLHGDDYQTVLGKSSMFLVTLVPGLFGLCAPSKIYAYLMAGKPVIASIDSRMEIAKDIKEYGAGIVSDDNSAEEIVNNIILVKSNKKKLDEMGNNARRLFLDKYEKKVCLHKYGELINELLAE